MNTCAQYKVGPDGTGSYRYMIDGYLSAAKYHNAESARHDARRPQRVLRWPPRITPAPELPEFVQYVLGQR